MYNYAVKSLNFRSWQSAMQKGVSKPEETGNSGALACSNSTSEFCPDHQTYKLLGVS